MRNTGLTSVSLQCHLRLLVLPSHPPLNLPWAGNPYQVASGLAVFSPTTPFRNICKPYKAYLQIRTRLSWRHFLCWPALTSPASWRILQIPASVKKEPGMELNKHGFYFLSCFPDTGELCISCRTTHYPKGNALSRARTSQGHLNYFTLLQ